LQELVSVLRAVLALGPEALVVVDHGGGVVYASPQVEVITGWSEQDLVGQPIARLIPGWRGDVARESATLNRRDGSHAQGEVVSTPLVAPGFAMHTLTLRIEEQPDRRGSATKTSITSQEFELACARTDKVCRNFSHETVNLLGAIINFNLILARKSPGGSRELAEIKAAAEQVVADTRELPSLVSQALRGEISTAS
jgi:hypothetical protein